MDVDGGDNGGMSVLMIMKMAHDADATTIADVVAKVNQKSTKERRWRR